MHTNEDLVELAKEFAALRQSHKKWFPKTSWLRAIYLAHQIGVKDVCRAINVPPAYFRTKMAQFSYPEEEMIFLEAIPPKYAPPTVLKVNIETSCGHKLTIEDIAPSCLTLILAELLKVKIL